VKALTFYRACGDDRQHNEVEDFEGLELPTMSMANYGPRYGFHCRSSSMLNPLTPYHHDMREPA